MSQNNTTRFHKIVTHAVFFATLLVIIPSILSILFPALLVHLSTSFPGKSVQPLELGILAIPFLSVNVVLLGGLFLLYYTGNFPNQILRSIKFILNFEVSKKVSLIVILTLLTLYVLYTIDDFNSPDEFGDFGHIWKIVETWPNSNIYNTKAFHYHVKNFLLYTSQHLFGEIRLIPFFASISLLILTYFFTAEITKKRFAGLVAMVILLQSSIFLRYDITATYSNFWTVFYLLSLYLIIKKWQFSSLCYILSLLSKPLTVLFFPMTLFFTYKINIPRKKKIFTAISYGVFVVMGIIVVFVLDFNIIDFNRNLYPSRFLQGFAPLQIDFRFDVLFIYFLLPLVIMLFMASKKGINQAEAVMFLIFGSLLSAPITSFLGPDIFPYRFIPFIVFFSIGVGTLFSLKLGAGKAGRSGTESGLGICSGVVPLPQYFILSKTS